MLGLSSATTTLPNSQLSVYMYQFKLQQARQDAAQAQDEVRALEDETRSARREADRTQDRVNTLERQAPQERPLINTLGQLTGSKLSVKA